MAQLGWGGRGVISSIGFTFASMGKIMSNVRPPAENHLCRDARKRHSRVACLLRRLPVQPLDRNRAYGKRGADVRPDFNWTGDQLESQMKVCEKTRS